MTRFEEMTREGKTYDGLEPREYKALVDEYAAGWEEGLNPEDWRNTTLEDIKESVKLDGIYEDLTEDEFNEFSESILNKVHDDGYEESEWYAVMKDREDTDWGFGDFDLEKAKLSARGFGYDAYIAVILHGECIREITQGDDGWSE